ncbi:MAG: 4Fe-4S dicluster domain-containing protein [Thermodesulfobacteriota bacterium]
MSEYYLFQDLKKCIGCRACEIQCKINKGAYTGPKICQIITVGPKMIAGLPRAAYIFMPCFHCQNPWCVAACPTGAMQTRPGDGVVFVDQSLCVGCKTCMSACPWGAPQWQPQTGKVTKCDYCKDFLDKGLRPACVAVCPTGALQLDLPERMPPIRRRRYAEAMANLGEPDPPADGSSRRS